MIDFFSHFAGLLHLYYNRILLLVYDVILPTIELTLSSTVSSSNAVTPNMLIIGVPVAASVLSLFAGLMCAYFANRALMLGNAAAASVASVVSVVSYKQKTFGVLQFIAGLQFFLCLAIIIYNLRSKLFGFDGYAGFIGFVPNMFVLLSAFVCAVSIVAVFIRVGKFAAEKNGDIIKLTSHLMIIYVTQFALFLFFLTNNIFAFYASLEVATVAMFFAIGIFGGTQKVRAVSVFVVYSVIGSVLFLFPIVFFVQHFHTMQISEIISSLAPVSSALVGVLPNTVSPNVSHSVSPVILNMAFWCMLASFAIKLSVFPLHAWLPLAHVQSPTSGSIILAGVMLKMGGYAIMTLLIPMFPSLCERYATFVMSVAVAGSLYAAILAAVQTDIKKIVAYSSVTHMGYVVVGLFSSLSFIGARYAPVSASSASLVGGSVASVSSSGYMAAVFEMLSHGVVAAGLFFAVDILYVRFKTRNISSFGGLAHTMPRFALLFGVLCFANIGLPATSGFIGEFFAAMSAFEYSKVIGFFAVLPIVLGVIYMLRFYQMVCFGCKNAISGSLTYNNGAGVVPITLNFKEVFVLTVVCCVVIYFGVFPSALMQAITAI